MDYDLDLQTTQIDVELGENLIEIELPGGARGLKGEVGAIGPQGPQGIQGPQGEQGEIGPQGIQGEAGPSNTLIIGTVTRGEEAGATITGESPNQTLNLTLPKGEDGTDGVDGFSPIITTSKTGKTTTITITDAQGTSTATILDGADGQGSGDMLTSVYDVNVNGIVDNAEKVNNHTVDSDVPSNAVFSYDISYLESRSGFTITNEQWQEIVEAVGNGASFVFNSDSVFFRQEYMYGANCYVFSHFYDETWIDEYYVLSTNDNHKVYLENFHLAEDKYDNYYDKTQVDTLLSNKADSDDIPTKVSELTNDSGFIDSTYHDSTKQNTLVSGTNIKTINNQSLLGSGDITLTTTESDPIFGASAASGITSSDITNWNNKQDALVSGTNIKTINSTSLLGSGDLDIGSEKLPIGSIKLYAGSTAPDGYLFCNGQAVSRTTYADLFTVIGTTYGSGDGSTTFNLPNLKGRVAVGLDGSDADFDTLGNTGGEKEHTLTIDEMPSHSHGMSNKNNVWTQASGYGNIGATSTTGANRANISTIASQGGGEAHNILQPYITLNYIIKASDSSMATLLEGQVHDGYNTSTIDAYSCNYVNNQFKNDYSANEITLTVGSAWTATSDGIVTYGGYSSSIMRLTVNGTAIGQCYGGNQANGSIYNSWLVFKGDVIKIDRLRGTDAEGNIHTFKAKN